MESSDLQAFDRVLDPTLWLVTASDGLSTGGLVATFVTNASIVREMPRMVVGLAKSHRTWELVEASGAFALHLLREEHLDLAVRFGLESGRAVDKLAGLDYHTGASGSPILTRSAGWLDCRVEARLDTGDRTLYLAEVLDASGPSDGPLLTTHGFIRHLSPEQRARLGELYAQDAATDAAAIRAWREARRQG